LEAGNPPFTRSCKYFKLNNYSLTFASAMPRPKDDTKVQVIFSATLALVLKTGFTGLKMADVAKAAKLATGTLYIYFKNKEVLINQLYLAIKKQKMEKLMAVFNPTDTFPESFKKLWYCYFKVSLNEPERMMFIEQYAHSSFLTKKTKEQSDMMLNGLKDILSEGMKQGIVKKLPVTLLLGQLIGPITELVKLQYDGSLTITSKLMDECFEMAWDSITN
jgi:TetR/AcrR family transcriptional regulator, repressor of fatR-cypB operon